MSGILKKIRKSIITKLILSNSSIILVVFLVAFIFIGFLSYQFSLLKEKQTVNAYLLNSVSSIDNKLKDMARVSMISYSDERTLGIIKNYKSYGYREQLASTEYIQKLFLSLITIRNDIIGIYIFDNQSLIFKYDNFNASAVKNDININGAFWLPEPGDAQNKLMGGCKLTVGGVPDFLRGTLSTNLRSKYFIYLAREVKSFSPHESIGYILLLSNVSELKAMLEQYIDRDSTYILFDKDGNIICESSDKYPGKPVYETYPGLIGLKGNNSGFSQRTINNGSYMVASETSVYSGLTLIIAKPTKVIFKDTFRLLILILFISIFAILCSVFLTSMFTRNTVQPIKFLSNTMESVGKDNIRVALPVTTEDELGRLTEVFNRMMNTINDLIFREYETTIKLQQSQIKQKEAQLLYLRSQINPHFLYNILDTIRIKAAINNDNEVSEMIMMLVDFFRFNIDGNSPLVTLEHEIALIQVYLTLMKKRHPLLSDEYRIDRSLDDIPIPSFILQPLVENSIVHGLKANCYKGCIVLSVQRAPDKDTDVLISLSDEGAGMSDEMLTFLNDSMDNPEPFLRNNGSGRNHIGIMNVQDRLRMFYPEGYGLRFYKNQDKGVTVQIRIDTTVNL